MTTIRLDVFHHVVLGDSENPLIKLILSKLEKAMATLDDVVAKVAALTTVDDSVVALLGDLKTKLDAAISSGADPAKLQALSDALGAQTQRLSDAVTTNTPAA
jgi:hypothetical protein